MGRRNDKPACPCGECTPGNGHSVRNCPATEGELALLRKARRAADPAKFMPAWLKHSLNKPPAPFVFKAGQAPVLPRLGAAHHVVAPPVYAAFPAEGGPFDGQTIEFAECPDTVPGFKDDQYQTAEFRINGTCGRYSVRTLTEKRPEHRRTAAVWVPSA